MSYYLKTFFDRFFNFTNQKVINLVLAQTNNYSVSLSLSFDTYVGVRPFLLLQIGELEHELHRRIRKNMEFFQNFFEGFEWFSNLFPEPPND